MTYAIRAAQVFDGHQVVDPPVVVVDGDRIVAVGTAAPAGVEVRDLGDATLLPGLVDCHQHLVFDGTGTLEAQVADRSDDELRERARTNARKALGAGITTIRDLGDRGFVTLDLRGDPSLPTILTSGPPITADGGHCWFLGGGCAGTDALLAAVEERRRRRCDVVKVMATGGALTPTFPMWAAQFAADQMAAVVNAAHAAALPVAAHCHGIDGLVQALDAGVDSIEHCSFFTENGRSEPDPAIVDRLAVTRTPVSATYGVRPGWRPPPVIEANQAIVRHAMRTLVERGGTVVAGTDAGVSPGKPHDVLPHAARDLVAIGLSRPQVITTLTATAAEVCGVGARKGRLAAGFDADMVAVGGDPLTDVDVLLDVRDVWRGGRRVDDRSC